MFDFDICERDGLSGDARVTALSHSRDTLTAREMVRLKVREQRKRLNLKGHVPLTRLADDDAEALVERQIETACSAITGGQILVFIDGRQITGLDEAFPLAPPPKIEFIRLVQLKGG